MAFSRDQQPEFRRLEKAAWQIHCQRTACDPKDKAAYKSWYRAELLKCTGRESTTACNAGRHYERACAHFEELAEDGIQHQMRLIQGDLKRIKHAIREINPAYLNRFANDAALETYARSIAAQATRREAPQLYQLDDREIAIVTKAIRIDAHRATTTA
jgi:hypothetical protein